METLNSNDGILLTDSFLQRAIEYWLDTANELTYQPLFCELLLSKRYVVKYAIKNTHFEQGKDVVAVNPEGKACGFQLKGGSINLRRWRDEVKPEIEALVECAIQHPDIDKTDGHLSYLVTNGEIEDNVRVEIIALNEGKWKNTPLIYWSRGDLLSGFQGLAHGIMPKDAHAYKQLCDLIFVDGRGLPDIGKINSFLYDILAINEDANREQRRRDIAAGMLYSSMIIGSYRAAKNHGSCCRVLIAFITLVFHLVDKFLLDDSYWLESYKLMSADLFRTVELLEQEITTVGFSDLDNDPMAKELIPFRKHSTLSLIYAFKLTQYLNEDVAWETMIDPLTCSNYKGGLVIWGEASFIPNIFAALIFKNNSLYKDAAVTIIQNMVVKLIENNGRNSKTETGLLSPYYDIDFFVKSRYALVNELPQTKFHKSSYYLKFLVEILVRFNQREFIAKWWLELSFFHFYEFVPKEQVEFYLYNSEEGENRTYLLKSEQSWAELATQASKCSGDNLPKTMKRFPQFLPMFMTIYPHRVTSDVIGFLFSKTAEKFPTKGI